MEINQVSFNEVAFAETLHQGVKRLLKAIRTEQSLTQRLEEAAKEKALASDFIGKNLMLLSDDELKTLARNYPDVEKFIDILIEGRSEMVSENFEAQKLQNLFLKKFSRISPPAAGVILRCRRFPRGRPRGILLPPWPSIASCPTAGTTL